MVDAVLQVSWSVVLPRLLLHSLSNTGAKWQHRSVNTHTSVLCDETSALQSRSSAVPKLSLLGEQKADV